MIKDAILTCTQKLTQVNEPMEPTTKKSKKEK